MTHNPQAMTKPPKPSPPHTHLPDDQSAVGIENTELFPNPNWVSDTWIPDCLLSTSPLPPPSDANIDDEIGQLVGWETQYLPCPDYLDRFRDRFIHVSSRQDSINWILKVTAHYRFSPVTAFLSVNYFDRFVSSHSLPASGWPFQLLSVACLSLAAKMEEPQVPFLLDLQVLEPGIVFEPGTVQRMELRVLSGLHWRLRSITPFDYLFNFISRLPSINHTISGGPHGFFNRIFKYSSGLILRTTRVIDFIPFPPSTVAAATVLCAAGVSFDLISDDGTFFHDRINKEMVRSCHQLIEEYLVDTCPSARTLSPQQATAPPSPVGVLDAAACGSCNTRSDNPGSSSQVEAEPPSKRLRSSVPDVQQQ